MIYLYTLAFIFLSLQDFYSYELMLPIVSVMGSILVIAISFSIHLIFPSSLLVRFPEKLSGLIFSMYIMPLICGLIVSSSITLNFSNGRLFSFFLLPLLVICFNHLYTINSKLFLRSFQILLYFHLIFFFFNLFDIYFLGHIFDPMIYWYESQATHFTYINGFSLRRACGLFQEPGTFSTYYALLLTGYINLSSRTKEAGNSLLISLSVLALYCSLSTFGIIFGSIIYFWQKLYLRSPLIFRILHLTSILSALAFIIVRFFATQLSVDSSKAITGLGSRFTTVSWLYENIFSNPIHTLFGFDILNPMAGYVDIGTAFNDSGMIVYFFLFTGLVGTTIFLISLAPFLRTKFPVILLLLLSKLTLFAPISAMIIFTNFIEPRHNKSIP